VNLDDCAYAREFGIAAYLHDDFATADGLVR
jgi:hypothetical protein